MDDDDSDQEFERCVSECLRVPEDMRVAFLQEDDDSTSISASFQGTTTAASSKRAGSAARAASQRKQSSSASAVTAAAAALLASSKLLGKSSSAAANNNKSSSKKKSGKPKKVTAAQSDSEEEPPPYTAGRGTRGDLDADPYAFDLDSSFHLKDDDEESDGNYSSSKKTKTKGDADKKKKEAKKKAEPVKRETKPVISLEDRVAQILKRTGSSAVPPPKVIDERQRKHSDDDEEEDGDPKSRRSGGSDSENSEKSVSRNPPAARQAAAAPAEKNVEAHDNGSDEGSEYDSKRLSLSDSLGMESADFESSLNSEKFAVNVDAMEESKLTTNPRYPTQNDTSFSAKSYDDDEAEPDPDGDDYGDEDFELDQTTVGGMERAPMSSYAESYLGKSDEFETSKCDADTSFVSQFEKMKEIFSVDSSFDPTAIDARNEEEVAGSATKEKSVEYAADNDNFGYEDEDFEPDEGVAQTDDTTAESSDQKANGEIADISPREEETQNDTPTTLTELPSWYLRPLVDADATDSHTPDANQSVEDSSKRSDAIDSNARPSEERANEVDEQRSERVSPGFLQQSQPPDTFKEVVVESPPMSPPPPPPPDDEDAEDDELNSFTLDGGAAIQHERAIPSSLMETVTTVVRTQDRSMERAATVDRFQHFQSHVSALRIIEAPQHTTSHNREKQIASRKQRKTPESAAVEPVVPPVDLEEESKEIEDFLRQSRRLKQGRQQMYTVRSSTSKENELALRLQHAQRQILQLKRHIQESEGDDESVEGEDDSVASVSSPLAITIEASEEATKNTAVRSSRQRGGPNKDEEAHHAISASELAKMKKEIQTQDTFIQAYQKENEQLMRQLKKIQQGAQYDAHVENEHLKKQLKEMREQLEHRDAADGGVDITNMGQYRLAVEARLHAEAHALSLQDELAAARATHQQRENELKLSLDRVKKAKVELECQYEGIDLVKIADETKLVKKLQSDLALTKKESEHALASLQKKMDWYVENQRLLDAQDEEVKRLKEETSRLKSETQNLRSQRINGSDTPGKSPLGREQSQPNQFQHHHRSAADIRRINELETRLMEMEEAMRKRHPDSLVNLILASRKAEEESTIKAMDDKYQQQLRAKEEEIEQIQETNEKKLKSFRQQQEKLVLLFQKRIREQEKQLQKADSHHHHHGKSLQKRQTTVAAAAVQDRGGDDEVKRVRKFYTEKIKELEKKWETKYRSVKKQQFSGGGSAATVAAENGSNRELRSLSYADSTIIITNLQRQLREKEAAIKKLTSQVRVFEEHSEASYQLRHPAAIPETNDEFTSGVDGRSELLSRKNEELSAYIRNVEAQLKASEEARSHLVATLSTLQTFTFEHDDARQEVPDRSDRNSISRDAAEQLRVRITDDLAAKFKMEIDALKKSHVDELTRARETISKLEEQACDHMDALEKAQSQLRSGHVKETRQLQQQISEAEQEKRVFQELADRVPFLENEVARLHEQLTIPRTPSMLQYRSLEMKIETLMQKHLLREAELKVLLSKATQSSELEKLQMERIHQNAIAAKNVEIRHFKKQLDDILYELELLRQPQAP